MATLRQFFAADRQPIIEFNERSEACQWREQPFTDIADLILDLPLLLTRGWRTGDWFKQVVIGQAQ
jgi:hypothetical protein